MMTTRPNALAVLNAALTVLERALTARLGLGLLAVVAATASTTGQQYRVDRFQLFNNCEPMRLVVEDLPRAAADIRLTRERLQFAAESRLRGARLYTASPENSPAYLYVNVNIVGPAHSIAVEYNKAVFDPASDESAFATTWRSGGAGTHGRSAEYIVSGLSRYLDRFLTEYLRVNESAC